MRKQRPINSCDVCRRRRLRCDKRKPSCSRCLDSRTLCVYTSDRPADAESSVSASVSIAPRAPIVSDAVPEPAGSRLDLPRDQGVFNNEGWGRSTYLESTFWARTLRIANPEESPPALASIHVACVPNLSALTTQSSFIPRVGRLSRNGRQAQLSSRSKCFRCGRAFSLGCIVNSIPPRAACEQLEEAFFSSQYPLSPIFHIPMFRKQLQEFWSGDSTVTCKAPSQTALLQKSPSFLALYLGILFSGSVSRPRLHRDNWPSRDDDATSADLYVAAQTAARLVGFPSRSPLYALISYLLIETPLVREEEFSGGSTFVDTAFRVALSMGLHRDPDTFQISAIEADTRRKVWWHVIHLDTMISASSGLAPLFLNEHLASTSRISEYEDLSRSQVPRQADVRPLVASFRYRCASALRRMIRGHLERSLLDEDSIAAEADDMAVLMVDFHQVQALLKRVANSELRGRGGHSTSAASMANHPLQCSWLVSVENAAPCVAAFCDWTASLLHLLIHKCCLVLYHPLYPFDPAMLGREVRERLVVHQSSRRRLRLTF
jgi:hypothetical protein